MIQSLNELKNLSKSKGAICTFSLLLNVDALLRQEVRMCPRSRREAELLAGKGMKFDDNVSARVKSKKMLM